VFSNLPQPVVRSYANHVKLGGYSQCLVMLNQQCDGVIGREYHGDIIQIELQRANNMRFGFGA